MQQHNSFISEAQTNSDCAWSLNQLVKMKMTKWKQLEKQQFNCAALWEKHYSNEIVLSASQNWLEQNENTKSANKMSVHLSVFLLTCLFPVQ